jgi:hypothetical protein
MSGQRRTPSNSYVGSSGREFARDKKRPPHHVEPQQRPLKSVAPKRPLTEKICDEMGPMKAGRASIPSQNMPNTIAVKKAKHMMAASTLSLL